MNSYTLFYKWMFFLLIPLFIYSSEKDIVVTINTKNQRIPIEISPLNLKKGSISEEYLQQIRDVFVFDMSYSGVVKIDPQSPFYIFKLSVEDNKLSLEVTSTGDHSEKRYEAIELSQDLSIDRRKIHLLSDTLLQDLFGVQGIASTKILFALKKGKVSEIYESDYDGHNMRKITSENTLCVTPKYIPGTKNFLYVSYRNGIPKIYYASLDGQQKGKRLISLRGNQLLPGISKDGTKLAFISDITGNPDLFLIPLMPAIGKPYQIYASRLATQGSPSFSPDGQKVAFVSDKDGTPRVYAMMIPKPGAAIKGIKTTLVSKFHRGSTAPAWSPDGTKIAYSAKKNGVRQIFIYDLYTRKSRQLTDGPGHKENPTWAKNSLHLIYNTANPNSNELFLLNLNQKETVKISQGEGLKRYPCWR